MVVLITIVVVLGVRVLNAVRAAQYNNDNCRFEIFTRRTSGRQWVSNPRSRCHDRDPSPPGARRYGFFFLRNQRTGRGKKKLGCSSYTRVPGCRDHTRARAFNGRTRRETSGTCSTVCWIAINNNICVHNMRVRRRRRRCGTVSAVKYHVGRTTEH